MELEYHLDDIEATAREILKQPLEKVILINGEMGAGKTTLIKAICKELGVKNQMSSPTFSLVNEYHTKDNSTIYHFDVYRLKNQQEALDIGIEEYLYSKNICFIEWSEKIPDLIPEKHTLLSISLIDNNHRKININ